VEEWSIHEAHGEKVVLTIYTDSQNIIGLPARRARLEQKNYLSRNNKPLKNTELYQKLYQQIDSLPCILVKVKGRKTSSEKDKVDGIFSLVDQAARRTLRQGEGVSSIECSNHTKKRSF